MWRYDEVGWEGVSNTCKDEDDDGGGGTAVAVVETVVGVEGGGAVVVGVMAEEGANTDSLPGLSSKSEGWERDMSLKK